MSTGLSNAAEQKMAVLVIGYGNTLRGDDGVGQRVAEWIEARRLAGVRAIACHQLTPELADPISKAQTVVFVDASLDLPDDEIRVGRVDVEESHQVMVHTASPGGLLHLARSVFGAAPAAWLVEIPVAEMGIGEQLSTVAERGAHTACARILQLIQS